MLDSRGWWVVGYVACIRRDGGGHRDRGTEPLSRWKDPVVGRRPPQRPRRNRYQAFSYCHHVHLRTAAILPGPAHAAHSDPPLFWKGALPLSLSLFLSLHLLDLLWYAEYDVLSLLYKGLPFSRISTVTVTYHKRIVPVTSSFSRVSPSLPFLK